MKEWKKYVAAEKSRASLLSYKRETKGVNYCPILLCWKHRQENKSASVRQQKIIFNFFLYDVREIRDISTEVEQGIFFHDCKRKEFWKKHLK